MGSMEANTFHIASQCLSVGIGSDTIKLAMSDNKIRYR